MTNICPHCKATVLSTMPTDDELAELIDGHMALDRLGVSRFAVDIEMTIGRRINLLVHEMEEAAKKPDIQT